jgi:uncharacterized protein VirK/YbjX
MANRYDVLTVSKYVDRNGEEKSFFTKIGTMFPNKNGNSFSMELVALPISDKEGKVRLYIKEPEQREGAQQVSRSTARPAARSTAEEIGDDLPF